MLKQFSAFNPSVKTLNKPIDRKTLVWTKRQLTGSNILPSPTAEINGKIYQLTASDISPDIVLLVNLDNFEQALILSLEIYGTDTVTFGEWLDVYKKCIEFGVDFTVLPLTNSIRKNLNDSLLLFEVASHWNTELTTWLEQKNIPWKTLYLLAGMNDGNIRYVESYVIKESPSLQSFRQFVEAVADFSDRLIHVEYDPVSHAKLIDRRSPLHKEVDHVMEKINSVVTVINKDNWETSLLHWRFVTKSAEQFGCMLKLLEKILMDVRTLYDILEGKGR